MATQKNIQVRAIADFSSLVAGAKEMTGTLRLAAESVVKSTDKMRDATVASSGVIAGAFKGLVAAYIGLKAVIATSGGIKEATNDAVQFDARMQTLNKRMGESAAIFRKWQNDTAASMGYSKLQAASYANTFSNMLNATATSQKDLTEKTIKLLETGAIIANSTGMAREEVSRRLVSAMNQEADGAAELGINVRESAIVQTKAFKDIAGKTPWAKLSNELQRAILYQLILDQTAKNYGNTIENNAAAKTAEFSARLKNLRLSLGQAFEPIWVTVLPALSRMVAAMDGVLHKVAVFLKALLGYESSSEQDKSKGKVDSLNKQTKATDGLTAATDALNKKKKEGSVAGFDEVNTLGKVNGTADEAVPGIPKDSDIDLTPETVPPPDTKDADSKIKEFAERIKGYMRDAVHAFDGISDWVKEHKDIVISSFVAIATVIAFLYGPGMIAGLATFMYSATAAFIAIIPEAWAAAAAFLAIEWPVILIVAAIAALAFGISMLVIHWKEVKEWASKVWDGVVVIWGKVAAWFSEKVIDPLKSAWDKMWPALSKGASDAWTAVSKAFVDASKWMYDHVIKPIVDFFVGLAKSLGSAAASAWTAVTSEYKAAGTWFKTNVIDVIVTKWNDLKTGVGSAAEAAWGAVKSAFSTVMDWFDKNIVTPVKTSFSKIADGLADGITIAFKAVYNMIAGYINGVFKVWNGIVGSNPLTKGLKIDYELPALAKGGITNGPMVAMIGDNPGGQEVVSPLDKLTGLVSTAVIQALQFVQPSSQSQGNERPIELSIDGTVFARLLNAYSVKENARLGSNMIIRR